MRKFILPLMIISASAFAETSSTQGNSQVGSSTASIKQRIKECYVGLGQSMSTSQEMVKSIYALNLVFTFNQLGLISDSQILTTAEKSASCSDMNSNLSELLSKEDFHKTVRNESLKADQVISSYVSRNPNRGRCNNTIYLGSNSSVVADLDSIQDSKDLFKIGSAGHGLEGLANAYTLALTTIRLELAKHPEVQKAAFRSDNLECNPLEKTLVTKLTLFGENSALTSYYQNLTPGNTNSMLDALIDFFLKDIQ